MKAITTVLTAAAAASAVTAGVFAQQPAGTTGARGSAAGLFAQWDADDNRRLTREEFQTGLKTTWFARADADDDERVTREELRTFFRESAVFGRADLDRSGYLERDEVEQLRRVDARFADLESGPGRGLAATDLYDYVHRSWDRNQDDYLRHHEFAAGTWDYFDEDRDSALTEVEFGRGVDYLGIT